MNLYDKLERLFISFLGDSNRGVSERGQAQYDCPFCGSGKPNLEVSFKKGLYSSWCCPTESGVLSGLIKRFGNERILKEYYTEITNIRESRLYKLHFGEEDDFFAEKLVELPPCCKPLDKENTLHKEAYQYLIQRGLDDDMIRKNNIHCTIGCKRCNQKCEYRYKIQNRVIFCNYSYGDVLDFWIGRTYKQNKYQTSYLLPGGINKRNIIWGYNNIEWDGEVRLVEGVLDAIPVPNAVPLLGKKLNSEFKLYNVLLERANSVLLIPDNEESAFNDWNNIYYDLNRGRLKGKIRMVDWSKLNTTVECKDTSQLFQKYGKKGIIELLKTTWLKCN